MAARLVFEFPYEGRNYGNAHEHFQRDGETWFKAGSSFTVNLGNGGTSPFTYQFYTYMRTSAVSDSDGDSSGVFQNIIPAAANRTKLNGLRAAVIFKLNTSVFSGLTLHFTGRSSGYSYGSIAVSIDLNKSDVTSKTLAGEVVVTVTAGVGVYKIYFNGELAFSSESGDNAPFGSLLNIVNNGMYGSAGSNKIELNPGTEISGVCVFGTDQTSLSHADNNWLPVKDYKVTKLRPVRQVVAEGEEPKFTAQEFDTGFSIHESETIRFETNFEPEEGARHIAIAGHPVRARFVRRGVRYGTASARPFAGNSALTHSNHPTSSGAKALTLLDIGATAYTNLDGHLWLNSSAAEPAQLKTIAIQANITQEPY